MDIDIVKLATNKLAKDVIGETRNLGIKGGITSTITKQLVKQIPKYDIRGVKLSDKDLEEATNVIFGELSNLDEDYQKEEIKTILNTAINRIPQYSKKYNKEYTLEDILRKPNQYQAYDPDNLNSQYNLSKFNKLDYLGKKKYDLVTSVINDIKQNGIEDNTNGRVFYKHYTEGENKGKIYTEDGVLFP